MINTTQYDSIGEEYVRRINSTKKYSQIPMILRMCESFKNKDILDLACGNGYFTKKMADYNPHTLTGIDISKLMIKLAKKQEDKYPRGIKYQVGDALKLDIYNKYDIVTAIYLLNYARNKKELNKICKSIFNSLKHNGIFATITVSPNILPHNKYIRGWKIIHPKNKKYFLDGEEFILKSNKKDGAQISIRSFYWSQESYIKCLKKAGFNKIEWNYRLEISDEGKNKYSKQYWEEAQKTSRGFGIKAVKP